MTTQELQSQELKAESQKPTKKLYQTPVLTAHGTVAQITESINPGTADGMAGSQFATSDRNAKQNFEAVIPQDILSKIVAMPVTAWSYKAEGTAVRHIGPMAQDFAAAFGVGDSDKHIHMVDANGVTMAAIQALYAMIQQRDQQIDGLRSELEQIKQRVVN